MRGVRADCYKAHKSDALAVANARLGGVGRLVVE